MANPDPSSSQTLSYSERVLRLRLMSGERQDPATERLIDTLARLGGDVELIIRALAEGRGAERLTRPDGQPSAQTFLDAAEQLVKAYVACSYLEKLRPVANDVVQLRANLLYLFQKYKPLRKQHGPAVAARLLEALPPPNDPEIHAEALRLFDEMGQPRGALSAYAAADQLTLFITNKRHGSERRGLRVTENYVSEQAHQDSTLQTKSPTPDFRSRVDLCIHMIEERSRAQKSLPENG